MRFGKDSNFGVWRSRSRYREKWLVFLVIILALMSTSFYCLMYPKFYQSEPPALENFSSGNPDSSEEPNTHNKFPTVERNDLTIQLRAEGHIYRPPRTIELSWNITKGDKRPDGVAKPVYLINGQFTGPLIEARSGDELVIRVQNSLHDGEGVAMHFHGIRASNEMDGVVGLTQCAISSRSSFTYRLMIPEDQDGTFWYHSHSETQRADGLYGPLVVHRPVGSGEPESKVYNYDSDQVLMVGDWYHRSAQEVLDSYTDWKSFKIEPAPDAMLLNGKGFFSCSMAVPARPVDCQKIRAPKLTLQSGRTRLRIINTGALTGLHFSMDGYGLELIKADGGNNVERGSGATTIGVLYPGERVDVIAERLGGTSKGVTAITVSLDDENLRFPNPALTPTQRFEILSSGAIDDSNPGRSLTRNINLQSVNGELLPPGTMPEDADKMFVLYSTISYLSINNNKPQGYINHTSWSAVGSTSRPLLALPPAKWPTNPKPFIPLANRAEWIDIVMNNMDDKGHPFHLHGHDFYVLAAHAPDRIGSYDLYNPFDTAKVPAGGPMNLQQPLKKDTVYVPSMGYVVLRFRADSPGLWLLHCHVLWHESVGMGMAFQIGDLEDTERHGYLTSAAINSCRA